MISEQTLQTRPNLYMFLPVLHVAWSDAILTPTEIERIKQLINDQDWLDEVDKELIKEYLDPAHPPSPSEVKRWLKEIRSLSETTPRDLKHRLVDMSLMLAKEHGAHSDPATYEKAKKALIEIEDALGVLSLESDRFVWGTSSQTDSQKPIRASSFDVAGMTALLNGDHADIINRVKTVLQDPKFDYYSDQTLEGYREKVLEWCQYLADQGFGSMGFPKALGGGEDMARYFTIMETLSYHDLSMVIKFGVQFGLFGMSVYFLGTEKHHKKYLKAAGSLELPGCFAMTETGHGSNVRDIETTATYHSGSRTFKVHTPNPLARKDYIGNAARHGQMATVFAKLIIDDVDYGVNAFLVPIRDQSGSTLPGVRIEDCGKKMGLNGVDNGRIWFDQVEIPYDNMLDQYASVSDQGEFESPIASDSRRFFTMLGTLVGGRIGIPRSGLSATKSGLAIAIKYGHERRQFGPENGEEIPILNYRTHQRRLMPLLANAYALHFTLQYLTDRFLHRSEEDMREIEALAAGLKSWATWNTTHTLQICREACGGKGFLHENRIGALKNDTEIYTTFEGDNTVLMQLVAKSRLTEFKQEFHDMNFFGMVNYIANQAKTVITEMNPIAVRNTDESHLTDPDFHLSAFEYRERSILTSAAKRLKHYLDSGMDSFEAFNQCQYHLFNVGMAHTERIVLEQFQKQVAQTEDPALQTVLKRLCDLFALSQLEQHKGWYLEQDYMAGGKTKAIRRMVNDLCLKVRMDAVPLVDAFDIPEKLLSAPIAAGIMD
ncbi:MAG: acyl-CoA dehydrogenase [Bacteroidota bacterium]